MKGANDRRNCAEVSESHRAVRDAAAERFLDERDEIENAERVDEPFLEQARVGPDTTFTFQQRRVDEVRELTLELARGAERRRGRSAHAGVPQVVSTHPRIKL